MPATATPLRVWLAPAEAAVLLRCTLRTVQRAIKDGSLPSFRWRGKRLIDAAALDRAVMKGSSRRKSTSYTGAPDARRAEGREAAPTVNLDPIPRPDVVVTLREASGTSNEKARETGIPRARTAVNSLNER